MQFIESSYCYVFVSHYLLLFVNYFTSYSQTKLWSYFITLNVFFIKNYLQGNWDLQRKGQFPICISSTSNSWNTNIVSPYKICSKNISDKDAACQCNICQVCLHLRCNKLNPVDYKYIQGSTVPWICFSCCSTILPFGKLTNKDFFTSVLHRNNIEISNKSSYVLLNPTPNLAFLFNQFKNCSPERDIDLNIL